MKSITMKLEQIEQRLGLFPDYLKEQFDKDRRLFGYIEIKARRIKSNPEDILKRMQEQGIMFLDGNYYDTTYSHVSFDQWLFTNKHFDLVDYSIYPKEEGIIDWIKNEGVVKKYDGLEPYSRENEIWSTSTYFKPAFTAADKWGFIKSV